MDRVPPVHNLPAELHLDGIIADEQQPPASPTDSDYCSCFDEDDPIDDSPEEEIVQVTRTDDWIELDLSAESAQSLNFLSDSDFQAVLKSFAEFTSQQFNNALLNLREIQASLTNHLAFLLWRRAVVFELRQRPPVYMELEHLYELLDGKWREDSELMQYNRQRFRNLADATTVPQLVLATFKTCFIRKRQSETLQLDDAHFKRTRQNGY